jgi:hypothetical protein
MVTQRDWCSRAERTERRIGSAVSSIGRTCGWLQISPFWALAGMV